MTAKSSQALFDEVIYRIFGNIRVCLSQWGEVLISGRNTEDHDKALETVLHRTDDFGITFNLEKRQFGPKEIDFYGH